jgi:membrane protease YdiL (CAAX protease family)
MTEIIKDFFKFYGTQESKVYIEKNSLSWLTSGYILLLFFKFLFGIIKIILVKNNLITSTTGPGSPDQWIAETSFFTFSLQVVILAPIYEEFAFRGIFQKNHTIIKFSLITILFLLSSTILSSHIYEVTLKGLIILTLMATFIFLLSTETIEKIELFFGKNVYFKVIVFSILFALWHYGNFDFSNANPFAIFYTFLPHFVSGLIFSWISLKKGFLFGLILHVINNLTLVLITSINHN